MHRMHREQNRILPFFLYLPVGTMSSSQTFIPLYIHTFLASTIALGNPTDNGGYINALAAPP